MCSKAGWFEAIVGKSASDEGDGKCFGFVTTYDDKSKRRLHDLLQTQTKVLNDELMSVFQRWYPGIGEVGGKINMAA